MPWWWVLGRIARWSSWDEGYVPPTPQWLQVYCWGWGSPSAQAHSIPGLACTSDWVTLGDEGLGLWPCWG